MSSSTYFVQSCPTCGRRVQIRVEYLGRAVVCEHCHGRFDASDSSSIRIDPAEEGNVLLQRAEELLESVAGRKTPDPRTPNPR